MTFNTLSFAQDLIRRPSVTPIDAGALDLLQGVLEKMGFVCQRHPFGQGEDRVDNLYARLGTKAPNFCYAGHVDVVPEGVSEEWIEAAFSGTIKDEMLWGRGAVDMKGSIAAFVGAVAAKLESGWAPKGSISFLVTGDEEGPAINGTEKLLKAITAQGEIIDHCLVGEPTNPHAIGDMIKNGRRGSLNAKISVQGNEGHVAYPQLALNPIPTILTLLDRLMARDLDQGNDFFQPSNLEVTSIDVGGRAHNVISKTVKAMFNIRFNTEHKGDDLKAWIRKEVADIQTHFDGQIEADLRVTGEAFLTEPGILTDILQAATQQITGRVPELSTAGGTSDARYICNYAPVAEFGLVGATMHKVNERVPVQDIETLQAIFQSVLERYFD